MNLKIYQYLAVLVFMFIIESKCEVFTAVNDLEHLIYTENVLIENLNFYLLKLEQKQNYFQKFVNITTASWVNSSDIQQNDQKLVYNFCLKKRLTNCWEYIYEVISDDKLETAYSHAITEISQSDYYPTKEDLNGAALALILLQDTYKLKPSDLANGRIKGVQYTSKMTASDCYQLGYEVIKSENYNSSILWLDEAFARSQNATNSSKLKILNQLLEAYRKTYNHAFIVSTMKKIQEISPNDIVISSKLAMLQKNAKEVYQSVIDMMADREKNIDEKIARREYNDTYHYDGYEDEEFEEKIHNALCRGELKPSPKEEASLRCRYLTHTSAFLKIAPLKYEEISLDPYIVVFHGVMYDTEIELIKIKSKYKLKRAVVQDDEGEKIASNYRISKAAWLKDHHHKLIADISRRVQDMSGLSMKSAEHLQIVNYGIGGYYDTHFDFALPGDNSFEKKGVGNRIATILFYMSDVAEGGATAFPVIRRAVFPKKGTAVFWWNLHYSGIGDLRTKHGGCPVLVGNKWVSNKWLHLRDQEFLRPCKLYKDNPIETIDMLEPEE